jgi:hypothetical protein
MELFPRNELVILVMIECVHRGNHSIVALWKPDHRKHFLRTKHLCNLFSYMVKN